MVTLHVTGTQLAQKSKPVPLNRLFLVSIAVLYLVAMHIIIKNPGGLGLALPFNLTSWLAMSFVLAIGFTQIARTQQFHYSKLTIGLFLSCLLMSLPALYESNNFSASSYRLAGLWSGVIFFATLQQFQFNNKHRQRLLWFIVIAVLIQCIVGYIQYFHPESAYTLNISEPFAYPYGVFQAPEVMTSFLSTGLVISAYLLARQPHKYNHQLSAVALLYLIPSLAIPLIIANGSFLSILISLLSIICILPYLARFSSKKRFLGWCASVIMGLFIGSIASNVTNKAVFTFHNTQAFTVQVSTLPQAVDMFIEKPFSGYGYGQFESSYILYTARQHQLNPDYPVGMPATEHPNNELLYWAVEGGLVPVIGMLLTALLVLSHIASAKKGTRIAMFSLFLPIFLQSQVGYPFYQSAIHWFTFIFLIFWVDQRTAKSRELHISSVSKFGMKFAAIAVPITTTVYVVTALHSHLLLNEFESKHAGELNELPNISNPHAWQERYDWNLYTAKLTNGIKNQDASLIQPYVDWSLELIQYRPRPELYSNLIIAYQALGEMSKAEQTRSEARYLFPDYVSS